MVSPTVSVSGLVLAGGQSSRMQSLIANKAWLDYQGQPLVVHMLARLQPLVACVRISANQDLYHFARYATVIPDAPRVRGHLGPLAGVYSALRSCQTDYLLCVPIDVPHLRSETLTALMMCAASEPTIKYWYVHADRPHPLIALIHRDLVAKLGQFLDQGHRRVRHFIESVPHRVVSFDDAESEFQNINTPDDYRLLNQYAHKLKS